MSLESHILMFSYEERANIATSSECFCGEAFAGEEESTCTAPCKGNTSEICGGSNRYFVGYQTT